ncbi:hypothetical protein [Rudaea sp.]|uniref:hypothetical protein n=1 Tax=Rudaea sp. TaxID=2136325 RepID=UPI002ED193DD
MNAKLRQYIASIAAAATMLLTTISHARHELTVFGGGGDATAQALCLPGQRLVGFAGRTGLWVDRIQPVCAKQGKNPVATGMYYGGAGGGESTGFCPRNWDMSNAAELYVTRGRQVASINFVCRSRATGETMDVKFGNPAYHGKCPGSSFFSVGNCDINLDYGSFQRCPADEVPIGFNVRYGKHVNAIGLICGRL